MNNIGGGGVCQVAEGVASAVVEAHGEVTDLTFLFHFQLFEKFLTNSNSIFQHTRTDAHTHLFYVNYASPNLSRLPDC